MWFVDVFSDMSPSNVILTRYPPPRYPSGIVLASSAGGPGSIPRQGPRHTKDVIKMVPVVPLFSTNIQKGKYWLFLKN